MPHRSGNALVTIDTLPWHMYPAFVLLLVGVACAVAGVRRIPRSLRTRPDLLRVVAGLRLVLGGIAVAGIGAALIWRQPWLLAFALVFGAEELLETSVIHAALRRDARR